MNKPVVIVNIEGGLVSHVLTSTKDVDVVIVDHDTDSVDEDRIINFGGGLRDDIPGIGERVVAWKHEPEQVDEKLAREIRDAIDG